MTIFKDKRADALVWLTMTAVVAVLGYWYPIVVAKRNTALDDRFGGVLVVGFFFVLMGTGVAIWSFSKLLNALTKDPRGSAVLGVLGGILLFITICPAVIVGWRILSSL